MYSAAETPVLSSGRRLRHRHLLEWRGAAASVALTLASCSVPSHDPVAPQASAAPIKSALKEPDGDGTPRLLRLMSSDQYLNMLAYLFGPDVAPDAHFAPFQRTDGLLQVGGSAASVNEGQLEQYQKAASIVAAEIAKPERREFLIPCKPVDEKAADTACATKYVDHIARLIFRRPVPASRVKEIVHVADDGATQLKDFYAGLSLATESILESPLVLYVNERSEPDPNHPGHQRLDAYSLAARLSFFLWNAPPDDALLKAAESGELNTAKGRAKIVDMMLSSPRLETGMRAFFDDMFGFDDFTTLSKDPAVYKSFTGTTAADAREQTLKTVIDQLITKKADYRDLYTTRQTFISPALAVLYNVPTPATTAWIPYEFPAGSERAGLLTQVSFLAVHSHPGRSSPTLRGKALREILLCQPVPRPPANVDFSIVENPNSNYHTARDRLEAHRSNPVCAGCHKIMDPMGLALENFNGAGEYRDSEKGAKIDPSGTLDGAAFKDVAGLGQALHDHPALTSCLVKRVFAYGTGGTISSDDTPILDYFNTRFAQEGYRLPDLLRSIALSNAFSDVRDNPPATPAVKAADAAASSQGPATASK